MHAGFPDAVLTEFILCLLYDYSCCLGNFLSGRRLPADFVLVLVNILGLFFVKEVCDLRASWSAYVLYVRKTSAAGVSVGLYDFLALPPSPTKAPIADRSRLLSGVNPAQTTSLFFSSFIGVAPAFS
jgi:hypothetical protein